MAHFSFLLLLLLLMLYNTLNVYVFSHDCSCFFLFASFLLVDLYSLQITTRGLCLLGGCFLRQVLGVCSVRIFTKKLERSLYEPTIIVHDKRDLYYELLVCSNVCDQILGNCTSVKIKLSSPVDSYTTMLLVQTLTITQTWFQ